MVTAEISYGIENIASHDSQTLYKYTSTIKTIYQSLNLGDRKELSWYHLSKFY